MFLLQVFLIMIIFVVVINYYFYTFILLIKTIVSKFTIIFQKDFHLFVNKPTGI